MVKRRNNFQITSLLLFVFLLYLSTNISPVQISLSDMVVSPNRSISQNYTVNDSIVVTNDSELAAVANNGTGTANDPYIIANRNITGSGVYGIHISGTTKHFRIENCWIDSSTKSAIFFQNVATGTSIIANNTLNNNGEAGIRLNYSGNSTVENNTVKNNGWYGIHFFTSGFSTITNNICSNNSENGLNLYKTRSSTITNNICNNNSENGLYLYNSGSSTVTSNICNNNGKNGINLASSLSLTIIANNTCNNNSWNGIYLINSGISTVANNKCNNNSEYGLYLYKSGSSTVKNNICNNNGKADIVWDPDRFTLLATEIFNFILLYSRIIFFIFVTGLLLLFLFVSRRSKEVINLTIKTDLTNDTEKETKSSRKKMY